MQGGAVGAGTGGGVPNFGGNQDDELQRALLASQQTAQQEQHMRSSGQVPMHFGQGSVEDAEV